MSGSSRSRPWGKDLSVSTLSRIWLQEIPGYRDKEKTANKGYVIKPESTVGNWKSIPLKNSVSKCRIYFRVIPTKWWRSWNIYPPNFHLIPVEGCFYSSNSYACPLGPSMLPQWDRNSNQETFGMSSREQKRWYGQQHLLQGWKVR